jgi:hypothetical protein
VQRSANGGGCARRYLILPPRPPRNLGCFITIGINERCQTRSHPPWTHIPDLFIHGKRQTIAPSTMTFLNAVASPYRALKAYRLPYPVKRDFNAAPTWWFTAVASCGIIITMLLTAAASAYEPISVYSRIFNSGSPLWYEYVLGNATSTLGLSKSRVCAGSIIQLGDGNVPCLR